jgi:periplasmic divalent cation tolerance protein
MSAENAPPADVVVLLAACPPDEAAAIARTLVGERWAACVNIIENVTSIYRWKGELCEEGERLLVVKTARNCAPGLIGRLKEIHPYEVPEILVLPVEAGNPAYIEWVARESGGAVRAGE